MGIEEISQTGRTASYLKNLGMETFIRIIMEYVIHCPLLEMRELRDGKIHNNYYGISHTFYVTVNVGT
jgi:hypothetical protein